MRNPKIVNMPPPTKIRSLGLTDYPVPFEALKRGQAVVHSLPKNAAQHRRVTQLLSVRAFNAGRRLKRTFTVRKMPNARVYVGRTK